MKWGGSRQTARGRGCRPRFPFGLAVAATSAVGCGGPQSTLDPAGRAAEEIAELTGFLSGAALGIWILAVALWIYAVYFARPRDDRRTGDLIIVGGGFVLPVLLLGGILTYTLPAVPDLLAPAPEGSLRLEVVGHQWWWRVRYLPPDGEPIELANEIRVPVGRPVQLELESRDVIHSFWIPVLGGKMDMIPGRRTRLMLEPTRTGTFAGACAEYCGTSHALMRLTVVVQEPDGFADWLAAQAAPAVAPSGALAERGAEIFLSSGCGACHTVRGTPADGVLAPDLTHVGSRLAIGAGSLASEPAEFRLFVAETPEIKPGVHMPAFGMLPPEDLDALAVYLEGLQ